MRCSTDCNDSSIHWGRAPGRRNRPNCRRASIRHAIWQDAPDGCPDARVPGSVGAGGRHPAAGAGGDPVQPAGGADGPDSPASPSSQTDPIGPTRIVALRTQPARPAAFAPEIGPVPAAQVHIAEMAGHESAGRRAARSRPGAESAGRSRHRGRSDKGQVERDGFGPGTRPGIQCSIVKARWPHMHSGKDSLP